LFDRTSGAAAKAKPDDLSAGCIQKKAVNATQGPTAPAKSLLHFGRPQSIVLLTVCNGF
jgi:hypothetical protein